MSPDSPENKCPGCGAFPEGAVGWINHWPGCKSGRIATDAELARDIATGIGGFWDDEPMGEDPPFGPDDVARAVVEVLVEGRLSPSAAPTNSVPSRSDSEGEGLAARIEELIEVVKGIDETVGSFGYSLGLLNVEGSAGDLEALDMVLDEAEKLADRARSLLVPKEEA